MPGIVTLKSRMRRAHDWMSTDLAYRFVAIGRTSPWPDETNPPIPDEKQTEVEELIGLQRIASYQYAKVIPNPTTLQKKTGIYYKGLYYSVTDDYNVAVNEGYTSIMCRVTLDRDTIESIPVGVTFRQIGLYIDVNATPDEIKYGITKEQWLNKSEEDRGTLEVIDNRNALTRARRPIRRIIYTTGFLNANKRTTYNNT